MIDDLKSCSVCGTRLASKWSKGDLVHYCAYCAVAECSDDAPALREIVALRARAEAAEQRAEALAAELAQARADRALLAGLWLIVVHHDVLPALLPTDQGDRDRLAAALDAVDRQPGAEARIAAGRAVIARIVAETGGGAA